MKDQFHTSCGLVQNALTELLRAREHLEHPYDCGVVDCVVNPARKILNDYVSARASMVEIPSFYLIRMYDALVDLAFGTENRLARYRAGCIVHGTRPSYRRAISVSAEVVERMAEEYHGTKTGRFFGRQSSFRLFSSPPMAIRKENDNGEE